jgi:hypothetical protein
VNTLGVLHLVMNPHVTLSFDFQITVDVLLQVPCMVYNCQLCS